MRLMELKTYCNYISMAYMVSLECANGEIRSQYTGKRYYTTRICSKNEMNSENKKN